MVLRLRSLVVWALLAIGLTICALGFLMAYVIAMAWLQPGVSFALAVFLVVRTVKRTQKPAPAAAPTTKTCPECLSEIPLGARRCAHCTTVLE